MSMHSGDRDHCGHRAYQPRSWISASAAALVLLASCSGGGGPTSGDGDGDGGGGGGYGWVKKTYGPADSSFVVQNDSAKDRTELVMASVPFAPRQVKSLDDVGVLGKSTSWRSLQKWPDGSIKIAQAQFFDTIKAKSKQTYRVTRDGSGESGEFVPHPWAVKKLPGLLLIPKVIDDDGVPYFGVTWGEKTLLSETKRARTRVWRSYLYNIDPNAGIKRDFLTARLYITEYRDMPMVSVEVVIGNDYQGSDNPTGNDKNLRPLGAVGFRKLELHAVGGWTKMRHRQRHGVSRPVFEPHSGAEVWTLLENSHFDDGQTKMWHMEVFLEDTSAASTERDAWRAVWNERVEKPLRPLATFDTWQKTDALGLLGGPAGKADAAWSMCEKSYSDWKGRNHFGPFGNWGDPKNTHTTGTPRNHPVSPQLAYAIQGENPHMLEVLDGMATQQACRQYHLWKLEVQQDRDIYMWFGLGFNVQGTRTYSRDHLGRYEFHANYGANDPYKWWRRNLPARRGHGWNPVDAEHATADLLFDHYTVTGSHWAKDEIEMLGQYVRGVWRFKDYYTSVPRSARAEGWMAQLLVAAYVATGNDDFKADVLRRIDEVINQYRHVEHPSRAMAYEKNYPSTKYPGDNRFIVPWQHAAIAIGFTSAFRFFGSDEALAIAEDAIRTAEYAMVRDYTNPVTKNFHEWNMRYYAPIKFSGEYNGKTYTDFMTPVDFFDADPNVGAKLGGGVPEFWKSATYLVALYTADGEIRDLAIDIGDRVLGEIKPDGSNWWNKWAMSIPVELLPANRISK